ncbi:MAG: hypothetical protein P4L59_04795 [Desulfosporosinus sp.]|nr:hypothetical protein [Desulfosporosinus sp.]
MNKQERASLIRKLKPLTWYTFCQMEALNPEEVIISKSDLMMQLSVGSLPTLSKYLTTWESYGLIRTIPGGYVITQLDGQPSGIPEEPVVREFTNAKSIIEYWCSLYEIEYGRAYSVTNWIVAQTQVKKLLRYPDAEIKATLQAIITLYERALVSKLLGHKFHLFDDLVS